MKYFISTILTLLCINCIAQREHHADIAYGYGKNSFTISGNVVKNFKVLKSEKLHLGVGARGGYFQGKDVNYLTAPAKHKKTEGGIDTVKVAKPSIISVNISLNASYHFNPQWSVGSNVDAFGFSFGKKRVAEFYPGPASQNEEPPRVKLSNEAVRTSRNNFFLTGNNNRGTLYSEVFVRYVYMERIGLKAGYSFITTEYSALRRIGHDNNYKFRNTSGQVMIGVSYSFI